MKTYKTWEAIKMINENKTLKFISSSGVTLEHNWGFIGSFKDGENVSHYGINSSEEWTLVQKAVDFMTAVKSGKRIRVEHESIEKQFGFNDYKSILDFLRGLIQWFSSTEIKFILTEGKFYIEE